MGDKGTPEYVNVSYLLSRWAEKKPDQNAVMYPAGGGHYGRLTFLELDRESSRLAGGLASAGLGPGTRTILMVRPSPEFFILAFAMFKVGAVPVVVDPGMGVGRMVRCFQESRPEAFIGIPLAHVVRTLYPRFFRTVRTWVTVGRRWLWGGHTLKGLMQRPSAVFEPARTRADDTAAILFTTGSTGPAKGVVYTHGNFEAQIRHIEEHFRLGPDEIDLPTFPLFALFDPALGMCAVIPEMDPTKPALVDPEKIIGPILSQGVTNMFASPALLNRVGRYGQEKGLRLPSLRRVVSAGAPVSPENIRRFASMLENGAQVHTPYGASEAVPITSIGSDEILSETAALSEQGQGMCVGRPLTGLEIRIIKISDEPLEQWSEDLETPPGEIGEIAVKGDLVTSRYHERPRDTALAKIRDGDGFWHRMGDVGRRDEKGRIWFCGRKSHRVRTRQGDMFTIPVEAVFNNHPQVFRSALVGVGDPPEQTPVICVELEAEFKKRPPQSLKEELLDLAAGNPLAAPVRTVLFHDNFPVDIRHNSKIFREKLAGWAAGRLNG